ncbi:hypothetical protein MSHOH_2135 [Methanosarcina horonobensis HB-1 = JCM 15518]|uniref:Uncharacterized protein n=2 Tax=Methanosarcina horonobensis TaxID=418008 RepID=A0A0E3SGD8_9EURY|nr:hypothetical protein MSHOH_2135 [Methanosarcina horonobensis HB-1 = JCM 15518]
MSDVVSQALNMLFAEIDMKNQTNDYAKKHQTEEQEQFEREIWKQKGIAYQKMGELEKAIECYDRALGIEEEKDKELPKNTRKVFFE